MPRMPVAFGGRVFASKGEFNKYLQNIWNTTIHYTPLLPEDEAVILDLLSNHPEEAIKVGAGVDHIFVAPSPKGGRCFHVMRVDGTSTDFGTKNCLDGRSQIRMFKAACRHAVKHQIDEARGSFFETSAGQTAIRQKLLLHADHVNPTFDCIVGKFIINRRINLEEVEFLGIGVDNSSEITFKDVALSDAFANFHQRHLILDFVTSEENLKRKRGAKKTYIDSENFVYVKPEDWEKDYDDNK